MLQQEKSGWCGPAVIQMALLAGGIKKSQKDIAKEVYPPSQKTSDLKSVDECEEISASAGFCSRRSTRRRYPERKLGGASF